MEKACLHSVDLHGPAISSFSVLVDAFLLETHLRLPLSFSRSFLYHTIYMYLLYAPRKVMYSLEFAGMLVVNFPLHE